MRKQVRYHHICEDEHSLMDKTTIVHQHNPILRKTVESRLLNKNGLTARQRTERKSGKFSEKRDRNMGKNDRDREELVLLNI